MVGSKASELEVGHMDGHKRTRPTRNQLSPCGEVRKAEAAGRNVTPRDKPSSEICEHGFVEVHSLEPTLCDMCKRFPGTWSDTWIEESCENWNSGTQAATKAIFVTYKSHPEVWNNDTNRELIKKLLVFK